ncbi:hypothetical protein [Spirosoma aerophilum]
MTTISPASFYQYTYPTFTDKPQWVYVHFLTPDGQLAFVTFPFHPCAKAAQLVPLSWFDTVRLVPLVGYSPLMDFLNRILPVTNLLGPTTKPLAAPQVPAVTDHPARLRTA